MRRICGRFRRSTRLLYRIVYRRSERHTLRLDATHLGSLARADCRFIRASRGFDARARLFDDADDYHRTRDVRFPLALDLHGLPHLSIVRSAHGRLPNIVGYHRRCHDYRLSHCEQKSLPHVARPRRSRAPVQMLGIVSRLVQSSCGICDWGAPYRRWRYGRRLPAIALWAIRRQWWRYWHCQYAPLARLCARAVGPCAHTPRSSPPWGGPFFMPCA